MLAEKQVEKRAPMHHKGVKMLLCDRQCFRFLLIEEIILSTKGKVSVEKTKKAEESRTNSKVFHSCRFCKSTGKIPSRMNKTACFMEKSEK